MSEHVDCSCFLFVYASLFLACIELIVHLCKRSPCFIVKVKVSSYALVFVLSIFMLGLMKVKQCYPFTFMFPSPMNIVQFYELTLNFDNLGFIGIVGCCL